MATSRPSARAGLQSALDLCATPVDQMPNVSAAAAMMADRCGTAEAAAKRLARYEWIRDQNLRGPDAPRVSDEDRYDAVEHIAEARVDHVRAEREAVAARRAYDEAVAAEKTRRRDLVQQAKAVTRARLIASGEAFLADLEEARLLDAAEYETLSVQVREADAMSGGGIFPRLAVIEPTQLRARLDALLALGD